MADTLDSALEVPRRRFGAVTFFAIYCILLFAIPAQLIVPGMGANGTPATLFALLGFGWWVIATLVPGAKEDRSRNPVRIGLAVYLAVVLVCWAHGRMRVLTALESTNSDRVLMATVGLAGIALVAMDGLRSMHEVERVVHWMVRCSMVMVCIGLVQFFFSFDLAQYIRIPGLVLNSEIPEIQTRSLFNRPRGTTLHPIEFGVVSAALIPLAYWRPFRLRNKRAFFPVAGLFLAAMASISRSAVLSFAVLGIVLLIGTSWRQRLVLVAATIGGILTAGLLINGLVGTLRNLFAEASDDPSVQVRLARWPGVVELVSEYPWLGRGFGVYTQEDYFLLDNEIQKTAIESGLIGLAVLILFIMLVVAVAWRTRKTDDLSRLFGTALPATILAIFISTYTFDAFFYKILMGTMYLSIGLVGATWRLTAAERVRRGEPDRPTLSFTPPARQPTVTT